MFSMESKEKIRKALKIRKRKNNNFKIRALMKEAELFGNPLAQKRCGLFDER